MQQQIKSLTVKNYKSLKDVTIQMDAPLTVLFGKNNVGKSNILEAIHLSRVVNVGLQDEDGVPRHEIPISFGGNAEVIQALLHDKDEPTMTFIPSFETGSTTIVVGLSDLTSEGKIIHRRTGYTEGMDMRPSTLWVGGDILRGKDKAYSSERRKFYEGTNNLHTYASHLNNNKHISSIANFNNAVASFLIPDFDSIHRDTESHHLFVRYRHPSSSMMELIKYSASTVRAMDLLALLLIVAPNSEDRSVFLLDDPLHGLSDELAEYVMFLITDKMRRHQVFMTTSSRVTADKFSIDEVALVRMFEGCTKLDHRSLK